MADVGEIAANQLTEITECPICMCEFTDPRMLPCVHTFCLECLRRTSEETQMKPGDMMPCPLCRKEFLVPSEGVSIMQKNFLMGNLVRLNTTLQTGRANTTSDTYRPSVEKTGKAGHSGSDTIGLREIEGVSSVKYCGKHSQKPLDYYCANCKKVVCVSCFVEKHKSHDCKDVTAIDGQFRRIIARKAWKTTYFRDELLSIRKIAENRKAEFLNEIIESEKEIRKRNLELRDLIDRNTTSLLEELSVIKSNHLKELEIEMEEIDRCCTILKNFEDHCTERRLKGSASDICGSFEELITMSDDLQKDHEAFLGGHRRSVVVSFETTDLNEAVQKLNRNIVGQIKANTKTASWSENYAVVMGLYDGTAIRRNVVRINLNRSNESSAQEQMPTKMAFEAFTAVYYNTIYVTGIGEQRDAIWKYNMTSGWTQCASLVHGRRRHSAAFVDEVLYICGGVLDSNKSVLDSVEAYDAVVDECSTVGKLVHRVRSTGNCVPYKNSLFIFGGSDENDKEVGHVQVYNTKENTCTLLTRPMPHPYMLMRAAVYETSVILVGPYTTFLFNFETEKWQEREKLKTDVVHFGLVLDNERIFVLGGGTYESMKDGRTNRKCRNDVRFVHLQDIIKRRPAEWKTHATLPKPSFVQACAKVGFTL